MLGKQALANNIALLPDANQMPFCIFSKHLQWLDYESMAGAAARLGFDGIDLTIRPGGHVPPEQAEEKLPRVVEAADT